MAKGPYSRIYHAIVDDPQFDEVMHSDAALGLWVKLLITADQAWPNSAPKPANWRRSAAYLLLTRSGLVQDVNESRYRLTGMDKERTLRSDAARNAAALRWHSDRNAEPMPRRDETSKEKTSTPHESTTTLPASFMGFKPRTMEIIEPKPDDPTDEKLIADLRRFASSRDEVIATNARKRLEKLGL